MDLRAEPLATAEFLAVDVETNGRAGDLCELTEVGAVLVGGGELHDRFESLVRVEQPLSRGIERFTGITQAMVDSAPEPAGVLEELAELVRGRVLIAHNASFDRRALTQACERAGVEWPAAPFLCTVNLARKLSPLSRQRKLGPLAASRARGRRDLRARVLRLVPTALHPRGHRGRRPRAGGHAPPRWASAARARAA